MARKQQVADNTHPTYDIMNRTMSSPFLMLSWQQNKINLYLTGVETLFKIIIELINVMFFHLGWNIRTKTDFFFRWTLFSYWWSKWNSLIRFRLKRGNDSCRGTEQVLPESHGNQTGEQSWWDVNSGTQCESSWSGTYSTHSQTIDHPDHCNVKQNIQFASDFDLRLWKKAKLNCYLLRVHVEKRTEDWCRVISILGENAKNVDLN